MPTCIRLSVVESTEGCYSPVGVMPMVLSPAGVATLAILFRARVADESLEVGGHCHAVSCTC